MNETGKVRLGLIPALAERHPAGHIGRTALMKYMYFLQTLRNIPLGYRFSMYSYGPFDSNVLSDLSSAEAMGVVSSTPIAFSGGFGYEIRPAQNATRAKQSIESFLAEHEDDVSWLFKHFGALNSAQLELASTVVYVNREFAEAGHTAGTAEIAARVREIKPHFNKEEIEQSVESLRVSGLILAA